MTTILDWVSPLRPDPTDIAEYTARVTQALSGVITLNPIGHGQAQELALYHKQHDPLFNVGNDVRFHGNILAMCQAMPGVIVAHDFRIQNLVVAHLQARHENWQAHYQTLMRRHYGEAGAAAARDFLEDRIDLAKLAMDYPGIEIAAENATGIITHNPDLTDELARRTGLACALLPLPFAVPDQIRPLQDPAAKEKRDLLVFGYIGHNRSLDTICAVMRERTDIRLHLAGQIGPPDLHEAVAALKREGYPIVDHGFVAEDKLDGLIHDSDLVLNLRHPSMGEVSGSQLRIFANGGLSVVCDTGWYGQLPDKAVFKIKPERIRQELPSLIDRIVEDPSAFAQMRREGYAHVKREHGLDRFAEAFTHFLAISADMRAHGRRVQLARHLGRLYHRAGAGPMADGDRLLAEAERILGKGTLLGKGTP